MNDPEALKDKEADYDVEKDSDTQSVLAIGSDQVWSSHPIFRKLMGWGGEARGTYERVVFQSYLTY